MSRGSDLRDAAQARLLGAALRREEAAKEALGQLPGGRRLGALNGPAPKLDDVAARAAVLAVLRCGAPMETACRSAGLTKRSLLRYLERCADPRATEEERQFFADFDAAMSDGEGLLAGTIVDAALGLTGGPPDWRACSFLLANRWPEKWGTSRIVSTVTERKEIRHEVVLALLKNEHVRDALTAAGATLPVIEAGAPPAHVAPEEARE